MDIMTEDEKREIDEQLEWYEKRMEAQRLAEEYLLELYTINTEIQEMEQGTWDNVRFDQLRNEYEQIRQLLYDSDSRLT
jgi:hypothetical protein